MFIVSSRRGLLKGLVNIKQAQLTLKIKMYTHRLGDHGVLHR